MIIAQIAQTGGQKTEILTTNHPKQKSSWFRSLCQVCFIFKFSTDKINF